MLGILKLRTYDKVTTNLGKSSDVLKIVPVIVSFGWRQEWITQ